MKSMVAKKKTHKDEPIYFEFRKVFLLVVTILSECNEIKRTIFLKVWYWRIKGMETKKHSETKSCESRETVSKKITINSVYPNLWKEKQYRKLQLL